MAANLSQKFGSNVLRTFDLFVTRSIIETKFHFSSPKLVKKKSSSKFHESYLFLKPSFPFLARPQETPLAQGNSIMAEDADSVKVFCRVRPPNERECGSLAGAAAPQVAGSSSWAHTAAALGFQQPPPPSAAYVKKCISVPTKDPLQQTVLLHSKQGLHSNLPPKTFTFDRVFDECSTQDEVFQVVGVPLTRACLEGYNGTIFAYGQTGSGKTFTMQGPDDALDAEASRVSLQQQALRGLVPRVFDYLLEDLQWEGASAAQHTFSCSFLEIYNERVYDLLDGGSAKDSAGLQLRENGRKGVFVEGLIESVVTNAKTAAELMTLGAQNRRVGQTAMNRESSRSHSVFILQIQSKVITPEGITKTRSSRFNLVDLAGSERQRNTEAAGERLKEAGSINKSLSALGNVIMGLVEQSAGKHRHVHYRDSKLTFLLKDSLGGNSKTFMIATISPAEDSSYETLSTLKFAQRAKMIRNNAVINEDTSGSVSVLQEEIRRLRRQLQQNEVTRISHEPSVLGATGPSVTISSQPETSLPPQCDPVVDARFRELEGAFKKSIEKNGTLKRSYEHLQLREERLKSLCADLKKNIIHLQMLLRLRARSDDIDKDSMEYEPSADAIEWRVKYEELEESFAQLQDEVQQQRMAMKTKNGDRLEVEVADLTFMLDSLTRQLGFVLTDKHDLQERLSRLLDKETQNSNQDMVIDEETHTEKLGAVLKDQSRYYESKLSQISAASVSAEAKAVNASHELLQLKQREAASSMKLKDVEAKLVQALDALANAENARLKSEKLLISEKGLRDDMLAQVAIEKDEMRIQFESKLIDIIKLNDELREKKNELENDLAELKEVHQKLEAKSRFLAETVESQSEKIVDIMKKYENQVRDSDELNRSLSDLKIESGNQQKLMERAINKQETAFFELRSSMKSELSAKDSELNRANENIERLEHAQETLEDELSALAETLKQSELIHQETKEKLTKSCANVDRLEECQHALESKLDSMQDECDKLASAEKEANQQLYQTQLFLKQSEERLLAEQSKFHQKCAELEALTRQTEADLKTQSGLHEMALKKLKEQTADELNKQIKLSEQTMANKQEEWDTLRMNMEKNHAEIVASARDEKQKYEDRLVSMQGEVTDLKKNIIEAKAESQKLVEEFETKIDFMVKTHASEVKNFDTQRQEFETLSHVAHERMKKQQEDMNELSRSHADELERLRLQSDITQREIIIKLAAKDDTIKQTTEQMADLQGRIVELSDYRSQIEEKYAASLQDIAKLKQDVATRNNENATLEQELVDRRSRIDELTTKLNGFDDENERLRKNCDTQQSKLQQQEDTIADLSTQLQEMTEKSQALELGSDELHSLLQARDDVIDAFKTQTDELTQQIHDLVCSSDEAKVELERVRNDAHSAAVAQSQRMKQSQRERSDEAHEMLAHCASLERELKTSNELLTRHATDLERLQHERTALEDERVSYVQELQKSNQEATSKKIQIEQLSSDCEDLRSEVLSWKNRHEQLQADRNSSAATVMSLRKELSEKTRSFESNKAEMTKLQSKIDALTSANAQDAKKIMDFQARNVKTDQQIVELTNSRDELVRTLDAIKGELQDVTDTLRMTESNFKRQEELIQEKLTTLSSELLSATEMIAVQRREFELKTREYSAVQMQLQSSENERKLMEEKLQSLYTSMANSTDQHHAEKDKFTAVRESLQTRLEELEQLLAAKAVTVAQASHTFEREKRQLSRKLNERDDNFNKQAEEIHHLTIRNKELKSSVQDLQAEVSRSKSKLESEVELTRDLKSRLESMSKELSERKEELARKESIDLKETSAKKNVSAIAQKAHVILETELATCRTRLHQLEAVKLELTKDKQRLQKDVQILGARLEATTKANDKLVGHHNQRQKIQHHIKVKEENNRLLNEVRQLTDEKLKLQRRVEKMTLALKEKENIGTNVPTPPSSQGSQVSITQKLSQSSTASSSSARSRIASPKSASKKRSRTHE